MVYSQYAAVIRAALPPDEMAYHAVLTTFTLVSAISGAALLFCSAPPETDLLVCSDLRGSGRRGSMASERSS